MQGAVQKKNRDAGTVMQGSPLKKIVITVYVPGAIFKENRVRYMCRGDSLKENRVRYMYRMPFKEKSSVRYMCRCRL